MDAKKIQANVTTVHSGRSTVLHLPRRVIAENLTGNSGIAREIVYRRVVWRNSFVDTELIITFTIADREQLKKLTAGHSHECEAVFLI